MKKFNIIEAIELLLIAVVLLMAIFLSGCVADLCDCEYVVYDKNPTNNYNWEVTYVSSWNSSCKDELLNQSTWYDSDNEPWYSRTKIECK